MNSHQINNISKNIKRNYRLNESEKTRLRAGLFSYVRDHTAVRIVPTRNPWMIQRHRAWTFGSALALMLIITLSSVSYAAEFSLPGEVLYSVKVNVTEPLRGSLQTTVENKAYWDSALVDRRLAEAQLLADAGELTKSKGQEITERLHDQTAKTRDSVHQLGTEDIIQAASLNARLEATLWANQELLDTYTDREKPANTFKVSLETQASSIQELNAELEADWLQTGSSEDNQQALKEKIVQLERRLATEQKKLEANETKKTITPEQKRSIQLKLNEAKDLIVKKDTTLSATSTNKQSLNNLQQAVKLQREIEILNQPKIMNDRSLLQSVYKKEADNKRGKSPKESKVDIGQAKDN